MTFPRPLFQMRQQYSVGRLLSPGPEDHQFAELEAAEFAALDASGDDCVYGVWENKTGELMAIVYQQTVFSPMSSQLSGYRQVVLSGSAGAQRARILDLLQAWYPRPLSRHQISEYTGIPLNAVCGRIAALMDKGDGYNRKRKPQVRVAETRVYEPTGSLRDYLTIIIKEADPSS